MSETFDGAGLARLILRRGRTAEKIAAMDLEVLTKTVAWPGCQAAKPGLYEGEGQMEYAAEEKVRNELSVKERLVSCSRPKRGIMLRPSDAFMIPWSLIWTGFFVFWVVTVVGGGAPLLFKIWGVPFLAAGLYMVLGRFIVDAMQRGKTYYGVTTERIIIISGLISRRVKSLAINTLSDISLTEKPNK